MRASAFFLDPHLAARALADVFPAEEAPKPHSVIDTLTLMPRLVASEARVCATLRTD